MQDFFSLRWGAFCFYDKFRKLQFLDLGFYFETALYLYFNRKSFLKFSSTRAESLAGPVLRFEAT